MTVSASVCKFPTGNLFGLILESLDAYDICAGSRCFRFRDR